MVATLRPRPMRLLRLLCLASLAALTRSDFEYVDFETIQALTFNGKAATTTCDAGKRARYNKKHGTMDDSTERLLDSIEEGEVSQKTSWVRTDLATDKDKKNMRENLALVGHRDDYAPHPTAGCRARLRLTPSEPGAVSSVWHDRPVSVLRGFQTDFAFQVRA